MPYVAQISYRSLRPMVTVANRMTLIEGVGDEVVIFIAILTLLACLMLAWFSTSVAEQPLIRTAVLVIERRHTSSRTNESNQENDRGVITAETTNTSLGKSPSSTSFQPSTSQNGDNNIGVTSPDSDPGTSAASPAETSHSDEPASNSNDTRGTNQNDNVDNKLPEECNIEHSANGLEGSVRVEKSSEEVSNISEDTSNVRKRVNTGAQESLQSAARGDAGVVNQAVIRTNTLETDSSPGVIRIRLKFLNDTQRMVEGKLEEPLGEFKRRYFGEELENDKIVRFIFNGQLLRSDQETLQYYGLFDNCVVHCQISNNIAPIPMGSNDTYNELDLSRFMLPLFGVILGAIWYCRIQYRQYFNATSTFALLGITGLFFVSLVALFVPRREHRPPAWVTDDNLRH